MSEKQKNARKRKKPLPIIRPPAQIWLLWNIDSNDWAIALDDPIPEIAYLWAKDFQAISALQKHQKEIYEVNSVPIRVH